MLRITDILIGIIGEDAMKWDDTESLLNLRKKESRWQRVWDLRMDKPDGG